MTITIQSDTIFSKPDSVVRAVFVIARPWLERHLLPRSLADWRAGVRKDTGQLQQSLTSRVFGRGLRLIGEVFSKLKLRIAVDEEGRKPGSKPPPPGVLLGWMARRNIPASRERGIAINIGRFGIPPTHAGANAYGLLLGRIDGETRSLGDALARGLGNAS